MKNLFSRTTQLIAVLLMALTAQATQAASTFTVRNSNNTFFISRSDSSKVETVRFRTVNMSAISGTHFTAVSDLLTFNVNEGTKSVTIPETAASSVDSIFRYQTSSSRNYRLEVLDVDGFFITSHQRNIDYGSNFSLNKSTMYAERQISVFSSEKKVTDSGYGQAYYPVNINSFFSNAIPQGYINLLRYGRVVLLIELEAMEADDGYQYIQILANETTDFDTGCKNGNPGNMFVSYYLGGFGHEPGKKNTSYAKYCFPMYDLLSECGPDEHPWLYDYNNSVGKLYQQLIAVNFRDETTGWLKLPSNVSTVGIRLNASGDLDDDWYARNVVARVKAIDGYSPRVNNEGIVVSPGPYNKGNSVTISVPFSEAVTNADNDTLYTTWGPLRYFYGNGSNVLTYRGTITAPAGTPLRITGHVRYTTRDLYGNYLYDEIEKDLHSYYATTENYTLSNDNTIVAGFDSLYLDNGVNKPIPIVRYRGTRLTEGVDYTVSYSDNYGPQTGVKNDATCIVTGIGKYSGSATGTFNILAVELTDFNEIEPDIYEIASLDDLMHLSGYVNNGLHECEGLTFVQTADIAGDGEFRPIGGASGRSKFSGTYDGQKHSISGLYITNVQRYNFVDAGIFGRTGNKAVVKDIVHTGSTLYGYAYVGGIVGENNGLVTNCHVAADVTFTSNVSGTEGFGGIVGINFGRVTGCSSAAFMNVQKRVGGIAGQDYHSLIQNCIYTGDSVISGTYAGALAGEDIFNRPNPNYLNNYYTNANQPGGLNGQDIMGMCLARTITLDNGLAIVGDTTVYDLTNLTAIGSSALITGNGTILSGIDNTVTLAAADKNYLIGTLTVMNGNTSVETRQDGENFIFTMPAGNVTVTATFVENFIVGDLNGDRAINIADLNLMVSIILAIENPADYPNADINGDGSVGIADLNLLINLLLEQQ